jgi:hypothetical protein
LRMAHDAQDARRTGLQHIDNNHLNATAKHWQTPVQQIRRTCIDNHTATSGQLRAPESRDEVLSHA